MKRFYVINKNPISNDNSGLVVSIHKSDKKAKFEIEKTKNRIKKVFSGEMSVNLFIIESEKKYKREEIINLDGKVPGIAENLMNHVLLNIHEN